MSEPAALPPRVAVLLLNWNGQADSIECMESLFRLDYPSDRLTVVLCDNASDDGSVNSFKTWAAGENRELSAVPAALQRLSSPPVPKPISVSVYSRAEAEAGGRIGDAARLVLIETGANLGFAGGNNVGLQYLHRRGEHDFVLVMNNDIVVAPDSLHMLVDALTADDFIGAVGGTLYEYKDPAVVQIAGGGTFDKWRGSPHQLRGSGRLDYVCGGFMLASLRATRAVGLISEGYFLYGEDVDYSLRLRRAGYSLAYAPAARAWHKGGGAVRHFSPRHDYYVVRNNLYLVRRFFPGSMPIALTYIAYRIVMPKIVRGQWSRLAHVWRGMSDFLRGRTGPLPLPSRQGTSQR